MPPIEDILIGQRNEILYDTPWESYCGLAALNPSTIVHAFQGDELSMKHLLHAWNHGRPDTPDLLWGRSVHTLLFEPQQFESRYARWEGDRRGKEYGKFLADATADRREVLTGKQWDSALEAAKSFLAEPLVQPLIESGKSEVTILARDGGVQCRGRIDRISSDQKIIDLKTAASIQAKAFSRAFYRFHYDIKLGLYQRWIEIVTGIHMPAHVIALEKEPPYDVAVIPIPDAVLERGARKGMEVVKKVRECIASGIWHGIAGGAEFFLDVPTWEMDEEPTEYDT